MPADTAATVVAQAALAAGHALLTLSAPAVARLATAGQFAMLRCSDGWDPYLRRPLPFLRLGGETVSFLFSPGDPGLAWLARRRLGDAVSLAGPFGRGFALHPATRRLLLVAAGEPLAPLLAFAGQALDAHISVSLAARATQVAGLASIIPEAVEVASIPAEAEGEPWGTIAALLPWADQVAAAGPADALRHLAHLGRAPRPGLVQCYADAPIACGLGWCGSCLTELRRGSRRACTSGPVFDLTELV
ncbi:MAG TPA: hypothetical protein PLJ35_03725 [Anaerolineae bacterium]|nr:hypothetical protein [Anaerolineae bacterium]HOQ97912.1 hypothetical protein [Anaerolineae bacterium]HPL27632.1 hypothetical protein [Anaerolineae bacterium]